jgi:hypothetical protein
MTLINTGSVLELDALIMLVLERHGHGLVLFQPAYGYHFFPDFLNVIPR